jgi:hypothetical protein
VAALPLIVSVAVREPPLLAPALNATVPLPLPELPLVITSHASLADAVHVHCAAVSTITVPDPPPAGTDCAPGRSVQLHGRVGSGVGGVGVGGVGVGVGPALAACRIVIVCPAIVTAASRAPPVLSAMFNVTAALPEPFGELPTVIQLTLLAAFHEHAGELAVTGTLIGPPLAPITPPGACTVKRHGAASCVRSTVASFTFTDPRRGEGSGFADTRYATVPSPCPLVSDVNAIHCVAVVAVHAQSRFVETVRVPVAPSGGAELDGLLTDTLHFTSVGDVTLIDEEPHPAVRYAASVENSRAMQTVQLRSRADIGANAAAQNCNRSAEVFASETDNAELRNRP